MMANRIRIAALRERADGEHRVSVTPQSVTRLARIGVQVRVEAGAGAAAWIADADYVKAGAEVCALADLVDTVDLVACVRPPTGDVLDLMHDGQFLVGLLGTGTDPMFLRLMGMKSLVGLDMSLLPRTSSNAQSMDAMTSQDSVAGYKAAVLAADTFGQYFPMMVTAAGTSRPARILVLGAGIAGLQAMGTARRLGAEVTGYDVRPECRSEIESLGATFLQLGSITAQTGVDGYAHALTADEQDGQQRELNNAVSGFGVVITTARVPGRCPPVLVTADAVRTMHPGSVVIDMASSALGGNVDGSAPDQTIVTDNGVTVIGAGNLASTMPIAASAAYARNIADVLAHFVRDHRLQIDPADPVDAAIVVGGRPVTFSTADNQEAVTL